MYQQKVPQLGLSLEKGTNSVPDDGRFHVVLHGEVIYSSRDEKRAIRAYVERKNDLFAERGVDPRRHRLTPEERVLKERAHRDIQALRMEAFERRSTGARKKGGRGGRGGV